MCQCFPQTLRSAALTCVIINTVILVLAVVEFFTFRGANIIALGLSVVAAVFGLIAGALSERRAANYRSLRACVRAHAMVRGGDTLQRRPWHVRT